LTASDNVKVSVLLFLCLSRTSGLSKESKSGWPAPIATRTPVPPVSPSRPLKGIKFPLEKAKQLEGIISYLSGKQGKTVQDEGISPIASKSVGCDDPLLT
jgi:hypothetical protein